MIQASVYFKFETKGSQSFRLKKFVIENIDDLHDEIIRYIKSILDDLLTSEAVFSEIDIILITHEGQIIKH